MRGGPSEGSDPGSRQVPPGGFRNARYTVLPVDGPLPWEMVRSVPGIRSDPLGFLARTVARYGDLVAFPMPRTPVLLVNTPEGAHRVLVANHRAYDKRTVQYSSLSAVTGAGLLTSDGQTWQRSRRAARPAFHHGRLDVVAREADRAARTLAQRWAASPGGVVDVEQLSLQVTMTLTARTLFGSDLDGRGDALVRAVLAALSVVVRRARTPVPSPQWLPTPGNRALATANRALDEACAALVAGRAATGDPPGDPDLLGLLLAAARVEGWPPRQVRDELVTMVIAGHETVATGLTWTLALLAAHPHEQHAVHEEVAAAASAADGGPVPRPGTAEPAAWGLEVLGDLPFTRAVVDEALRLYPPAWVVSRRVVEDDVVDGVPVPAGTLVLISPWLLHRRPADFPDPESFRPQRFVVGDEEGSAPGRERGRVPYAPFGAGPRLCIGRDMALVTSVLVLAGLLREHRVEPVAGRPLPAPQALVTVRPHGGLPLRLVRR